jgi:hypothetical protein
MTKFADSFASILGVVAACLLSVATASTCSVALADATPNAAAAVCKIDILTYKCPTTSDCVSPKPNCAYAGLDERSCACKE